MKTRVWHITFALIFAIVFMGVLSAGLAGRSAQAMKADWPIGRPMSIGLASNTQASATCGTDAPVAIDSNNLQVTFWAQKDTFVRQNQATTNYGTLAYLRAGTNLQPYDVYQTLVQFDISALPANAVIVTATLELYSPVTSTPNLRAYAALGTWTETGVTWDTKPAHSTDYGSQIMSGLGWHKWNVTALAQQWQAGTRTNNGFLLTKPATSSAHSITAHAPPARIPRASP